MPWGSLMALSDRSRSELIDQALEGQSAEVKARVLAIIIRYNIDVRNEFFLIFVAIGHLLAIVEESPENWRALFDDFKRDLDQWTQANLQTLKAIHQQGEAADRMSQAFLRLTDSIKLSSTKTSELLSDFRALNTTLASLKDSLANVNNSSQVLASRFSKTETLISQNQTFLGGIFLISCFLSAVVLGGGIGFYWQQMKQGQRIKWLLEKATRQECVSGVKPADDPQCRQYQ
jgi:hypothetical protein